MRVLVTGASGLLGGDVARALAARGDDVTVLQRRPSGLRLREVLGDITELDSLTRAVDGCDAVVHLAAKVNVTGSWEDYRRINVDGTEALLQACLGADVRRMVFVSSPSVAHAGRSLVGAGSGRADPERARGHYARSKAMAEQRALAADARGELAVVAVRPHIVWGPGDTQLVERIGRRARSGRLPVIGSGAPLVDTIYIDNAVDALVAALDRCDDARGQSLVVTNGEPRPIGEILAGWARATGAPAPTRHVPAVLARWAGSGVDAVTALRERLGHDLTSDPPITRFLAEQLSTAHWFDQRRTRQVLGWAPRVSLDEGFARMRRHYAHHPLT
ncbi:NAD-dependent epimerase/dehydratase family protein [Tessaracoccus antarcticus]|uniref:NAD-dependent epimerase/dehydratase family protein n=1 Tax=Tessaracoccus antarcticus TaxID=2479848 RepID=A0A3M0GCI0_9ACTN|nr:NAD-dependent epimerase/dehydratase family protein [Tessaracoccus antarcticus]RMB62008.1 NAD-dependent epimerase/dehydratase family protein [Tessaracoccus antarcticus]